MDALANLGNLVKATQFIGQSSGLKLHSSLCSFSLLNVMFNEN